MAQSNYTPILIYGSTTPGNVPSAGNLTTSSSGVELALNAADGKLFYKDNGGVVRVIAQTSSVTNVASISFGTTGLTPSTATTGAVTVAGTLATTNGGTGLTSFTANRVFYASSTSAIAQSANLTFDGTTLTANNFTDSSLTSGRVTYATTGGNLTDSANLTFDGTSLTLGGNPTLSAGTANGVAYLNGSKVLTTGSALTYVGGALLNTGSFASTDGTNIGEIKINAATLDFNTSSSVIPQVFRLGSSEQMRLTSTGLGIGTSSPANKLVVSNAGAQGFEFDPANGIIQTYNRSGGAYTDMRPYALNMRFFTGSSPVETMRLDAAGNLGLGVTPSAWGSGIRSVQVGNYSALTNNQGGFTWLSNNAFYDTAWKYLTTNRALYYAQDTGDGGHKWFTAPTGTAGNPISFTQAMTLTQGGNLLVGTTSDSGARIRCDYSGQSQGIRVGTTATTGTAIQFVYEPATQVGTITTTTTSTAYNTSSDYRLKNITGPVANSGAYIDALKPVEGTWKADGSTFVGLIAHEAQEVSRTTVATGTKDGEQMQAMDYGNSEFIANIIAELQSLRARVAQLETKGA